MELAVLLAQTLSLAFLAAWLTIGVAENILHPSLNATFTAEVLDMKRMREGYPEAYAEVAHRRVTSPGLRMALFRMIVFWELMATLMLWIGVGAFGLSALSMVDPETARILGLTGAMMFTSVWAGFLVAGNWWCYWFGHEGAQNTHFQMTLWGMANVLFVACA